MGVRRRRPGAERLDPQLWQRASGRYVEKDLQNVYKIEERKDPSSGKQLLFILPQDIIDNTIKAFSTSATSATGYGSAGPPSGRYFAPANGPDCLQVVQGDCAPRETR